MIIVKKELLVENEIPTMDGIAKIKRCKSSNIWQFSMWIKKEKKYYRATTGTRNTEQAIEIAQSLGTSAFEVERTYVHLRDETRKRFAVADYKVINGYSVQVDLNCYNLKVFTKRNYLCLLI